MGMDIHANELSYCNTVLYCTVREDSDVSLSCALFPIMPRYNLTPYVSDENQHRHRATLPASVPTPSVHPRHPRPSPAY